MNVDPIHVFFCKNWSGSSYPVSAENGFSRKGPIKGFRIRRVCVPAVECRERSGLFNMMSNCGGLLPLLRASPHIFSAAFLYTLFFPAMKAKKASRRTSQLKPLSQSQILRGGEGGIAAASQSLAMSAAASTDRLNFQACCRSVLCAFLERTLSQRTREVTPS